MAGNCSFATNGAIDSAGGNVESAGNSCQFDQASDLTGVASEDLALGDLAGQGGRVAVVAHAGVIRAALGLALVLAALALGPGLAIRIALVQAVVVAGFSWASRRQIGGQTGDVLGATQQLAEIAGWLVLAALGGGGTGGGTGG